jgi:AhpD family alkylhydroperoxidase
MRDSGATCTPIPASDVPHDGVIEAIAVRPGLADALKAHAREVLESGTVPAITKELCAAMVSAVNFCEPSLVEHRAKARELGASAEMLNDLWDYARSTRFTDAQKAALAAAVALTREPRGLPDAVSAQLRAEYDEAQIAELLCAIGFMNYVNRVSNALRTGIVR